MHQHRRCRHRRRSRPAADTAGTRAPVDRHPGTAQTTAEHQPIGEHRTPTSTPAPTETARQPICRRRHRRHDTDDDDLGNPAGIPPGINLDIQLVMTDRTLFDGDNEPAILIGHGPIPAPIARQLVRTANPKIKAWIRRLYTDPQTGHLINGDGKRRDFSYATRQFLVARDHTCRTAWCDAPIRHTDHVTSHATGGPSHHRQRPRHLRSLQLHQRSTRLARHAPNPTAPPSPSPPPPDTPSAPNHPHHHNPHPGKPQQPTIIEIITAPAHPVEIDLTKADCARWWSLTSALLSGQVN